MNSELLNKAWKRRSVLYAEVDKLYEEGDKLFAEGNKLLAEGDRLYAEGRKLQIEGRKLQIEGDRLYAEGELIWLNTVLEVHNNIEKEWLMYGDCKLETGEVFKFGKEVV